MSQTKAQLVQPVGVFTGTGINVTGVITATSFVGSGEGLTGVASTDNIITGTAATFNNTVQVNSTLTANSGFTTNAINTNLNVTGVTTIATVTATSLTAATGVTTNATNTNLNVTGVGTFAGSLTAATGNIGNLNITKSAAGAGSTVGSFTGVTTYYGDGSGLTGVGESIAPWYYNPNLYSEYNIDHFGSNYSGIGITFNKKIVAGSGTATLKICNAGVAGTTVQSWGISSATFPDATSFRLGAVISNLQNDSVYQIDIPEGFVKDSNDKTYVGTAYTFDTSAIIYALMGWGAGDYGQLNNSSIQSQSSPVQIPGDWLGAALGDTGSANHVDGGCWAVKRDGTMWTWGGNSDGQLGQNNVIARSSPVQIPGTTWSIDTEKFAMGTEAAGAIKTDGTLWSWGYNNQGGLGQNQGGLNKQHSSPAQIPGTTWAKISSGRQGMTAIKTDGTMWSWGYNRHGMLGLNQASAQLSGASSPIQIPGTTWRTIFRCDTPGAQQIATKTDGTLWAWGGNASGSLGQNEGPGNDYSSPVQIPGTSWASARTTGWTSLATRTDGTLWAWGRNAHGQVNKDTAGTHYSSPVQIPGTNWGTAMSDIAQETYGSNGSATVRKTDGTLWSWGYFSERGQGGHNNKTNYSSPKQIGTDSDWISVVGGRNGYFALKSDATP